MYDSLDDFINLFGDENSSEDYWYDVALFEAMEMVNKFDKDDWDKIAQNISLKSKVWKIRMLESFGSIDSLERIIIASSIFEGSSDDELLMAAIDYLRNISFEISSILNEDILQKLNALKDKSKINKGIIDKFILRAIKST
jgi:lin0188 protein